jgi:hypothetical protein
MGGEGCIDVPVKAGFHICFYEYYGVYPGSDRKRERLFLRRVLNQGAIYQEAVRRDGVCFDRFYQFTIAGRQV